MRVIVEVRSGPTLGHRITVRAGQVIQFGRTERADVVFPYDDGMSGVHFSIEVGEGQCVLRDLESTNGTLVNDQFVTTAALCDGDIVSAGNTLFGVAIEDRGARGATGSEPAVANVRDTSRIVRDTSRPLRRTNGAGPTYRLETCSSGLTLMTGFMLGSEGEPATITAVAQRLADTLPSYLIVDFKKAGLPFPGPDAALIPVFDWLPPDVAAVNSPLIVTPDAPLDRNALLESLWDQDAVVVFFSQLPTERVTQHLRAATHLNVDGSAPAGGPAKGMLGYCWPSVLAPLLAFRTATFVQSLLSGIDAVLLEIPDLPGTWQLYAHDRFAHTLAQIGFREVVENPC